jgi:hypothetical protein
MPHSLPRLNRSELRQNRQLGEADRRKLNPAAIPPRLRDYGVPRDLLPQIVAFSMRNCNADRNRAFLNETEGLTKALEDV